MKYYYFCNGKACKRNCAENGYAECHHTSDENYATNKVRRNRRFECIRSSDGVAVMHEITGNPYKFYSNNPFIKK